MTVLAYDSPEQLEAFVVWGGAFLVLIGCVGGVATFTRWAGKRMDERIVELAAKLDERTKQIQPDANGGESLADIARGQALLMSRQVEIGHELSSLRTSNDITHDQIASRVVALAETVTDHLRVPHDRRVRDDGPPDGVGERRRFGDASR